MPAALSPTSSIARSTASRSPAVSLPHGLRAVRPAETTSRTVAGACTPSWARCGQISEPSALAKPLGDLAEEAHLPTGRL